MGLLRRAKRSSERPATPGGGGGSSNSGLFSRLFGRKANTNASRTARENARKRRSVRLDASKSGDKNAAAFQKVVAPPPPASAPASVGRRSSRVPSDTLSPPVNDKGGLFGFGKRKSNMSLRSMSKGKRDGAMPSTTGPTPADRVTASLLYDQMATSSPLYDQMATGPKSVVPETKESAAPPDMPQAAEPAPTAVQRATSRHIPVPVIAPGLGDTHAPPPLPPKSAATPNAPAPRKLDPADSASAASSPIPGLHDSQGEQSFALSNPPMPRAAAALETLEMDRPLALSPVLGLPPQDGASLGRGRSISGPGKTVGAAVTRLPVPRQSIVPPQGADTAVDAPSAAAPQGAAISIPATRVRPDVASPMDVEADIGDDVPLEAIALGATVAGEPDQVKAAEVHPPAAVPAPVGEAAGSEVLAKVTIESPLPRVEVDTTPKAEAVVEPAVGPTVEATPAEHSVPVIYGEAQAENKDTATTATSKTDLPSVAEEDHIRAAEAVPSPPPIVTTGLLASGSATGWPNVTDKSTAVSTPTVLLDSYVPNLGAGTESATRDVAELEIDGMRKDNVSTKDAISKPVAANDVPPDEPAAAGTPALPSINVSPSFLASKAEEEEKDNDTPPPSPGGAPIVTAEFKAATALTPLPDVPPKDEPLPVAAGGSTPRTGSSTTLSTSESSPVSVFLETPPNLPEKDANTRGNLYKTLSVRTPSSAVPPSPSPQRATSLTPVRLRSTSGPGLPSPRTPTSAYKQPRVPSAGANTSPGTPGSEASLDDFMGLFKTVIAREKGMSIRDAAKRAEQRA